MSPIVANQGLAFEDLDPTTGRTINTTVQYQAFLVVGNQNLK